MREYKLYIDGKWVAPNSGETFASYNPFTQEPWATVSQGDATDVQRAVDAARNT